MPHLVQPRGKNKKKPLFPVSHPYHGSFSSLRHSFQAEWQIDQQLLSHMWESKCPIEFGTIWATVALCRLVARPVPTATTRPVCALRSSLICYRHSSGSAPCTVGIQSFWVPCVYFESWPRIIAAGGKPPHRFPALASTIWLKETSALCPLQLSRQHTVLNATPSFIFRLDI